MDDDLSFLEEWATPLLQNLSGPELRSLAKEIGQALRRSQIARIAAQQNPDGTPYVPRKAQQASTTRARQAKGRIRRSMFTKLRTARLLKLLLTQEGVELAYLSRTSKIAIVHQEGRAEALRAGGPKVRYPARVLLGLTDGDHELIRELILKRVSE